MTLQAILEEHTTAVLRERAARLFVDLAKAQPFGDGNKRTALFAANSLLLEQNSAELLIIPNDDHDSSIADLFNDLLARAYMCDAKDELVGLLLEQGFMRLDPIWVQLFHPTLMGATFQEFQEQRWGSAPFTDILARPRGPFRFPDHP